MRIFSLVTGLAIAVAVMLGFGIEANGCTPSGGRQLSVLSLGAWVNLNDNSVHSLLYHNF